MESCHSVIVSSSPLFVDAVSHILQEENIKIIKVAISLREPQPISEADKVTAIIIDGDDPLLNQYEIINRLPDTSQKLLVVLLSLTKNQMDVLQRERINDVTPAMLIDIIKNQR